MENILKRAMELFEGLNPYDEGDHRSQCALRALKEAGMASSFAPLVLAAWDKSDAESAKGAEERAAKAKAAELAARIAKASRGVEANWNGAGALFVACIAQAEQEGWTLVEVSASSQWARVPSAEATFSHKALPIHLSVKVGRYGANTFRDSWTSRHTVSGRAVGTHHYSIGECLSALPSALAEHDHARLVERIEKEIRSEGNPRFGSPAESWNETVPGVSGYSGNVKDTWYWSEEGRMELKRRVALAEGKGATV